MMTKFLSVSAIALMLATPALAQGTTTPSTPPATTQQQSPSMQQSPSTTMAPSATTGSITFIQTQHSEQWLASRFMDRNVYDMEGNSIGDVNDVLIGRDGRVMAVVVGVGGFLGIGEKNVAVPFDRFQLQAASARTGEGNTNTTTNSTTTATPAAPAAVGESMWSDRNARLVLRTTRDELRNAPTFEEWSDRSARTNTNTDQRTNTPAPAGGTTTAPAR